VTAKTELMKYNTHKKTIWCHLGAGRAVRVQLMSERLVLLFDDKWGHSMMKMNTVFLLPPITQPDLSQMLTLIRD
jgi:hypothetical protein